tara:strand:- start:14 stop:166 length:153 start_codon:yes stop_codon:yes gene_type:complete
MPTKNMFKLYGAIPELFGMDLALLKYGSEATLRYCYACALADKLSNTKHF